MLSVKLKNGEPIHELEAALLVIDKLLKKKLDEHPNGGMTLAKSKPNEYRISYAEVARTLKILDDYLGIKGVFSLGICKTCQKFNPAGHTPEYFGTCGDKTVHCYDTCLQHSPKEVIK